MPSPAHPTAMLDPAKHVKPFVYASATTKALHFSMNEI